MLVAISTISLEGAMVKGVSQKLDKEMSRDVDKYHQEKSVLLADVYAYLDIIEAILIEGGQQRL